MADREAVDNPTSLVEVEAVVLSLELLPPLMEAMAMVARIHHPKVEQVVSQVAEVVVLGTITPVWLLPVAMVLCASSGEREDRSHQMQEMHDGPEFSL